MGVLRFALVGFLAALVLAIKIQHRIAVPNFWAEDGTEFWLRWTEDGFRSFLEPYAGYLHLMPRTVAAFSGLFPEQDAIKIFLIGAIMFTIWTSLTIASAIPGIAGIIASLAPLLAYGGSETLGTPTNLQWIAAVGLAAISISKSGRNSAATANDSIFVLFSGLSGPFSIFMIPIFSIRAIQNRKNPPDLLVALLALCCGIVQAWVVAHQLPPDVGTGRAAPIITAEDLLHWSVGGGIVGFGSLFIVLISLFYGQWKLRRIALFCIVIIIFAAVIDKFQHMPGVFNAGLGGQRYWFTPSALFMLIISTLLIESRLSIRLIGVFGMMLFLYGWFQSSPDRAADPFVVPPRIYYESWAQAINSGASSYTFPPDWTIPLPHRPVLHRHS